MKSLAAPIVWGVVFLVLGLIVSKLKRRGNCSRAGWWLVLVGTLILLAFGLKPVANTLTYSLECRCSPPRPEQLAHLDIVVVLGGDIHPAGGFRIEPELSGPSYSRVCHGVRVFTQSKARLLALCGGPRDEPEAPAMKALAIRLGVAESMILIETQSQNTMENAARLADLLGQGQSRQIGLVTSATHMLRSERVFREYFPHDVIVPAPANYTYDPSVRCGNYLIPSAGALLQSTVALHEWIGLLWYSFRQTQT